MTYIHELRGWPDLTWKVERFAEQLAAVRHRQGLFVGRLGALGLDAVREAGLTTLTAEVVKSSAIEGERLPPEEVRSSIARRLGIEMAGLVPFGREVEGIVAITLDATQRYQDPVTAGRLFDWHRDLFPTGRSGGRPMTVGAWRTDSEGPMQVVSGSLGNERVHYEAPAATRLDGDMARFLAWINSGSPTDPVVQAAIAHLWFVTIHPFDDGNGRIARVIAELLLTRADGRSDRSYSMSTQLEAERGDYYRQLESAQRGGLDVTQWIEWFLGCLDRSLLRAETTLARVFRDAAVWELLRRFGANGRQQAVLRRLLREDWEGDLKTSKYAKLAKCSSDTALRDIQQLVHEGVLARNAGGGRSVSYRLAEVQV